MPPFIAKREPSELAARSSREISATVEGRGSTGESNDLAAGPGKAARECGRRIKEGAMSAAREKFFECVFSQDRNEYRFHVRAWDPQEAEEQLRASLRDNGVRPPGTILIRDTDGTELLRAEYQGPRAA